MQGISQHQYMVSGCMVPDRLVLWHPVSDFGRKVAPLVSYDRPDPSVTFIP